MNNYKILFILYLTIFSNFSSAEIYQDFLPFDSLSIIKSKYPNAKFEDTKAAWVKEDESLIKLTGAGIPGSIFLKFSTGDSILKFFIKTDQEIIDKNPIYDNSYFENNIKKYNALLALPLDQRLTLDWVRFVPPNPIPFARLVSKYGNPEKYDFDPENFQPFCSWDNKGLNANLSDDKKYVYAIEYSFTDEDRRLTNPAIKQNSEPKVKEKPARNNKVKKLQN